MKNKILLVIAGLLGLVMINSGMNKFFHYMEIPDMGPDAGKLMMAFMESGWMFPLIALAEIIGGILIILPKTRALGAIVLFPVILGILLFHIALAPNTVVGPIIFFAVNLWVIAENWSKYKPMIEK